MSLVQLYCDLRLMEGRESGPRRVKVEEWVAARAVAVLCGGVEIPIGAGRVVAERFGARSEEGELMR
jgi:hypothetical protein